MVILILAEELLGIFYEADNDYDRRAGHANEEHDLQDVHCEHSDLKHIFDCIPVCREIPLAGCNEIVKARLAETTVSAPSPRNSISEWEKRFDTRRTGSYSRCMEIYLTPEQESELSYLAAVEGKRQEDVAREVLGEGLAAKAQFISAVQAGREAARRGEFVEPSALWADVDAILNS